MTDIITDPEKIAHVLTRGVEEVIEYKDLEEKLKSGKELRIKLGIDPTSPNLHLGRTVPLLKLRDFQELGHKIVFLIGNMTGGIGDTSDKESERPMLEEETLKKNLERYVEQASKILDMSKTEVVYNADWLGKLTYREIGAQADAFSLHDFISRENIKKRLDEGKRVSLRELLYPLMQGYDSVAIHADVELGGTDQKFNLLAGRDLQRLYGQTPQNIVMGPIVEGLDGRKMSSSYGNGVNILDDANNMFGKIMSLKDEFIIRYFTLLTRVDLQTIAEFKKKLDEGENPKNIKLELGKTIVTMYHSQEEAEQAMENWQSVFSQGNIPENIQEITVTSGDLLLDLLVQEKFVDSKGEGRRLFEGGAIRNLDTDEKIEDYTFAITDKITLKIGKKSFARFIC